MDYYCDCWLNESKRSSDLQSTTRYYRKVEKSIQSARIFKQNDFLTLEKIEIVAESATLVWKILTILNLNNDRNTLTATVRTK